jgi:hypothetical protein
VAAPAPAAEIAPAPAPIAVAPTPDRAAPRKHARTAEPAPAPPEAPAAAPAPAPSAAPASANAGKSLDDLLDSAVSGKRAALDDPSEHKREEEPDLPELTKDEIVGVMRGIKAKAKECYKQFRVKGLARVKIAVGQQGEVASASVVGPFADTATGGCILDAVKLVSFPASKGMRFDYPVPVR